jgi:hypothetical protein
MPDKLEDDLNNSGEFLVIKFDSILAYVVTLALPLGGGR